MLILFWLYSSTWLGDPLKRGIRFCSLPIGPSECPSICFLQDVIFPSNVDLLEAMISFEIPSYPFDYIFSNDYIFELDSCAIKSNLGFPPKFDLTICESSNIGIF